MKNSLIMLSFAAVALSAVAQDNLLAEKPIFTLGEVKTWTYEDQSYTFKEADLPKLVAVPTNTSNVYLYPEQGDLSNDAANQALGMQGFYIDLEATTEIGTVTTTWEGAAADSFSIYLTDVEPTPAILDTDPTYSVSGLGQYTSNTAVMPDGAKGRYLVFQGTKATNWGWGVKMRSISATAPADDILTSFSVSPGIVALGEETSISLTFANQFGIEIPATAVSVTVTGDGDVEYADGKLTIVSGTYATFMATMNDETLTATVYAATAPEIPAATSIKTPVYTNGITDDNSTAEFTVNYNGGAVKNGVITFENGAVAQSFGDARCIFFSNSATTGAWNGNIYPADNGYRSLRLDVFSSKTVQGYIDFEGVENLASGTKYYFDLTAGEWTNVEVDILGATKLSNMSIRFTEENMTDILLTNIFFTPAYIEGDEEAPVLSDITAEASMTEITLSFSATDNLNDVISYSISVADKSYNLSGNSGETVEYTISGLNPNTEYEISVVASDGLNTSEPKTMTVKTTGMLDSPRLSGDNFELVYSSWLGSELPDFDAWTSTAVMGALTTENGNDVLGFSNYNGQWGGLVNLEITLGENAKTLHIDVFTDGEGGTFDIAPVWKDANGATTPGTTVTVVAGEWTSYDFELTTFGFPAYGMDVIQLALTNSTLSSFAVDNIYFAPRNTSAVENIAVDETLVNVVSLQGIVLRQGVNRSEAANGLPAGLYIIGGQKVIIK